MQESTGIAPRSVFNWTLTPGGQTLAKAGQTLAVAGELSQNITLWYVCVHERDSLVVSSFVHFALRLTGKA